MNHVRGQGTVQIADAGTHSEGLHTAQEIFNWFNPYPVQLVTLRCSALPMDHCRRCAGTVELRTPADYRLGVRRQQRCTTSFRCLARLCTSITGTMADKPVRASKLRAQKGESQGTRAKGIRSEPGLLVCARGNRAEKFMQSRSKETSEIRLLGLST